VLMALLGSVAWCRPLIFEWLLGEPVALTVRHPLLAGERVDINQASASDLQVIAGLGPATAEAIVLWRDDRGPFYEVGDLRRVRGVGSATVAKFDDLLTVGDIGPRPPPVPVDLNRASVNQLDGLPGIGPVLAQRIVEHRTETGPFDTVEDLIFVHGIGPATLGRLRERIGVTP
jgi:competence ComEA-like helix-hairpin-helix protein